LPASYAGDVFVPLVVLGALLSIAFVVLTQEAVAEVEPDERGLASGIFETANHLFGGAVGVVLYASVLTATSTTASDADGYRAAFLAATGLALLGLVAASQARARPGPSRSPIDADRRRRRVPQRGPVAARRRR
jgi:MFS family permease